MYKRFNYYQKGVQYLFLLSFVVKMVNDNLGKNLLPEEIIDYLFWLSLGLWLGFILCSHEFLRVRKIEREAEQPPSNHNLN